MRCFNIPNSDSVLMIRQGELTDKRKHASRIGMFIANRTHVEYRSELPIDFGEGVLTNFNSTMIEIMKDNVVTNVHASKCDMVV